MVDNNYMKCYSTLFVSSMKCVSQQSILCPYVLQVQLTQSRSRQRQAPRIALHTNVATAMGRKYSRGKIIFQSSFKIRFSFSAYIMINTFLRLVDFYYNGYHGSCVTTGLKRKSQGSRYSSRTSLLLRGARGSNESLILLQNHYVTFPFASEATFVFLFVIIPTCHLFIASINCTLQTYTLLFNLSNAICLLLSQNW